MLSRIALALLLLSRPAFGWEAISEDGCQLRHTTPQVVIVLSHYPSDGAWGLFLRRLDRPWPAAPEFSIRFEGARPGLIATGNHFHPDGDAHVVAVIDQSFAGLLDGLATNDRATATLGGASVAVPLAGAAPAVAAFRACTGETPA